MYAVIKNGGKQYRLKEGEILKLESFPAELGSTVELGEVLMVGDGDNVTIGTPTVASAKVTGLVLEQGRHKKVKIIKFRRRKHHMKRMGHRQNFTAVKITKITA